jgi:hypothetical protein
VQLRAGSVLVLLSDGVLNAYPATPVARIRAALQISPAAAAGVKYQVSVRHAGQN